VNVDINGCNHFFGHGQSLEGEIKRHAQDFEVREVHFESTDSQKGQPSCNAKNSDGCVDPMELDPAGDVTAVHGMEYVKTVITAEMIDKISDISSRYYEMLLAARENKKAIKFTDRRRVAVQIPMKMSKKERGMFHIAIKDSFPYILTAAMSTLECKQEFALCDGADGNEKEFSSKELSKEGNGPLDAENEAASEHMDMIEEEHSADYALRNEGIIEDMAGIWVSADASLYELAGTALTMDDITALYAFKIKGPHHKDAKNGIKIGLGLSREDRTSVYKIVTSNCLSLDSKTAEDRNNKKNIRCKNQKNKEDSGAETENNSKSMIIFWRKKASFSKGRKFDEGDADGAVESELHVGFKLCKINTEHLGALQKIAQVAGVAVSDVSFCGIKDKKAVTYQRCVITLRCHAGDVLEEDDVIEHSDECLKNVLDRNMRNHASNVITSLTQSFPYPHVDSKEALPLPLSTNAATLPDDFPSLSVYGFFISPGLLRIGALWGNSFKIRIRNIAKHGSATKVSTEDISTLKKGFESVANSGFPNFFGSQRMGYQELQVIDSVNKNTVEGELKLEKVVSADRPLGPVIGKLLLLGKYQKAMNAIILGTAEYVRPLHGALLTPLQKARFMFYKGFEPGVVLSFFPSTAVKERILLKAIVRFGCGTVRDISSEEKVVIGDELNIVTTTGDSNNDEDNDNLKNDDMKDDTNDNEKNDESHSNIDNCSSSHNNDHDSRKNNNYNNNKNTNRIVQNNAQQHTMQCEESASKILSQLPYSTRSLWVSSYQSWLWNRAAAHRLYTHTECGDNMDETMCDNMAEKVGDNVRIQDSMVPNNKEMEEKEGSEGKIEDSEVLNNDGNNGTNNSCSHSDSNNKSNISQRSNNGDEKKGVTKEIKNEINTKRGNSDVCVLDDDSLIAMVGDLVHVNSLAPYLLKSPTHTNNNSNNNNNDDNNKYSSNNDSSSDKNNNNNNSSNNLSEESNTVTALSEEILSGLSLADRRHLFKHCVVLPLFGKKMIYPTNSNGTYVRSHARSHVHVYMFIHKYVLCMNYVCI
jgi:tRNA(Glu) U13 pseudouridine synthase TruD